MIRSKLRVWGCAGNDINELYAPRTSPERYKQFWVTSNALMARLYSSPLATVAAIRGACPAGGCGLALCCDVRLMSREVGHIGLNEVALGIPVPLFWGRLMTRVIGQVGMGSGSSNQVHTLPGRCCVYLVRQSISCFNPLTALLTKLSSVCCSAAQTSASDLFTEMLQLTKQACRTHRKLLHLIESTLMPVDHWACNASAGKDRQAPADGTHATAGRSPPCGAGG